jgi:hypothetical protein
VRGANARSMKMRGRHPYDNHLASQGASVATPAKGLLNLRPLLTSFLFFSYHSLSVPKWCSINDTFGRFSCHRKEFTIEGSKTQEKAGMNPCSERDSNPRFQFSILTGLYVQELVMTKTISIPHFKNMIFSVWILKMFTCKSLLKINQIQKTVNYICEKFAGHSSRAI